MDNRTASAGAYSLCAQVGGALRVRECIISPASSPNREREFLANEQFVRRESPFIRFEYVEHSGRYGGVLSASLDCSRAYLAIYKTENSYG